MTQDRPKLPPLLESLRAWLFPTPLTPEQAKKLAAELRAGAADEKKECGESRGGVQA